MAAEGRTRDCRAKASVPAWDHQHPHEATPEPISGGPVQALKDRWADVIRQAQMPPTFSHRLPGGRQQPSYEDPFPGLPKGP